MIYAFLTRNRGVLDKMRYGNEGERQKGRSALIQMSEESIKSFITEINRVLKPSCYLMLWIDKFHLCEGVREWLDSTLLQIVDLITWDKGRMSSVSYPLSKSTFCRR